MTEPFYGYAFEHERRDLLKSCSLQPEAMDYVLKDVPEEIDSRKWHRIENQQNMGSCQGHMNSSLAEFCYYIATGQVTQFSPLFAYYSTQEIDGLAGADNGSTIYGGAQSARTRGSCPLEVMPYPNPCRYNWHLPEKAIQAAAPFKVRTTIEMKSERDVFKFIASGQGGVGAGIRWLDSMTPNSEGLITEFRGSRGGGHAIPLLGYTKRKATDGRNFYLLPNSWSQTWGINGWAEVHPKVVDAWFADSFTVIYGFSDLTTPTPRKIDYALW